jgi:hypothetical protein
MVNPQYPTFESWYNEIEITAFRSERFLQHLDIIQNDPIRRNEFVETWLRAAFEVGRNPEDKYI